MSVISICLSPGFQRSVSIDRLVQGEVNRLAEVLVDISGKGINVCRVLQRLGVEAVCLAQGGSNAAELVALAHRVACGPARQSSKLAWPMVAG
jgi:fructose-1-phosphate kinase PfkB-like protein